MVGWLANPLRNARYRHPAPTLAPRGSPAPDDGTTTNRLTPIFSILTNAVRVVSGDDFTMAVLTDGTLWAVGRNDYGQLGLGTVIERATPAQVPVGPNVAFIAAGEYFALVIVTPP